MRVLELGEVKTIAGRTIPTVMTMRPQDGSDEYTRVTWKELRFDVRLESDFFSVRNLSLR
jgi:hypothetical protein